MSEAGTASEPAEHSLTSAALKRSPFDLPEFVQQLLGYAGFAYVVGFATLVANTARYGIPLQEFAKPLTFWAGAIPTITVFLTILIYRKRLEGHPEHRASLRQVAGDLFILAVCVAVGRATLWYVEWFVRLESRVSFLRWWDKHSLAGPWVDRHPLAGTAIILIYCVGVLAWQQRSNWNWKDIASTLKERFFRYGPSVFMAVILALYIWVGYPQWPQQYGFGKPLNVRLLVDRDNSLRLPLEASQPGPPTSARPDDSGLLLTAPLQLLFKTDKEYVVQYRVDNAFRIVSIDSGEVKGTVWK